MDLWNTHTDEEHKWQNSQKRSKLKKNHDTMVKKVVEIFLLVANIVRFPRKIIRKKKV